jgi:hypothetical protein
MRDLRYAFACARFVVGIFLTGSFSLFPAEAAGQSGPNAVYNSSGSCSSSSKCTASPAFIDASVFGSSKTDFCAVLNGILNGTLYSYPSAGAVIDARGLPGTTGTSMTCTVSPWGSGSSYVNMPSTILLPATGGGTNVAPIVIPSGWVLPANTHLIGVADGDVATSGSASYSGTTIQACESGVSGCTASFTGTMLSMCSSACSGVSIENLSLDGQGLSINGIANGYASSAYVKNVSLFQITGTGLTVSGSNTPGSGPYTNIMFDTKDQVSASTTCLNITASATQGFHKITCSSVNSAPVAVELDGSNTSLTDIRIVGFTDGILVGSRQPTASVVLRDVWGDTNYAGVMPPTEGVVVLSSNAKDVAAAGVGNMGNTPTIDDTLTSTLIYESYVGLYALGEPVTGAGYTRFTTSANNATNGNGTDTNAVTWGTGSSAPVNATSGPACAEGSLFSCVGTTSQCQATSTCSTNNVSAALWVCGSKSGTLGWCGIK